MGARVERRRCNRLAKVVVGAPGTEGVTMGALASLDQREEELRSLKPGY